MVIDIGWVMIIVGFVLGIGACIGGGLTVGRERAQGIAIGIYVVGVVLLVFGGGFTIGATVMENTR